MFKIQRHSRQGSSRSGGERFDFKFSNFQAIQVPKGWDKLLVSVICVETGKTIAKSSKAPVRNGNCQWSETLSESINTSQNESPRTLDEFPLKFVVAMGSARAGILGEATVNMGDYMSSKTSVPIFLPLKKCNHGTILQVKIQCLNPNTKLRAQESKNSVSQLEEQVSDHVEVECRSYESEDSFAKNCESSSNKDLSSASNLGEVQSTNTSFSETGSHHSFDSVDGSVAGEFFPPNNEVNGEKYTPVRKQGSTCSVTSSSHNNYSIENPSHRLSNSRYLSSGNDSHLQESLRRSSNFTTSSALANSNSSKTFLEAAEETIQELRAEAKTWERNARKLMLEMDIIKKDFSNQSLKQADKDVELTAAYAECDGLKKEIEQLKLVLEETMVKEGDKENSTFQSESGVHIIKEMELEIKFQHEYNSDLALQLKRSQESNIELVTVLQELEETIEKQKSEIKILSLPNDNQALTDMEMEYELKISAKEEEIASLKAKIDEILVDRKSDDLSFVSGNDLQKTKIENLRKFSPNNNHGFLDMKMEYELKVSAKEEEISILRAKVDKTQVDDKSDDMDLIREVESLKGKLQELERDCSELTAENLELLLKLKDSTKETLSDYSTPELPHMSFSFSESGVRKTKPVEFDVEDEMKDTIIKKDQPSLYDFPDLVEQLKMAFYHVKKPWLHITCLENEEFGIDIAEVEEASFLNNLITLNKLLEQRISQCEFKSKERNDKLAEAQKVVEDYCLKEKNLCLSIQELESSNTDLHAKILDIENQVKEKLYEIKKLEGLLMLKDGDLGSLREFTTKLEVQISNLENEKDISEEMLEILQKENNSRVSTNQNLMIHLKEPEESNSHLLETTASLEAQLRGLTNMRESNLLEMDNSKSVSMSLKDEIKRLEIQIEAERTDFKQKLQDLQNQMLESQNESENLKLSNQILEASAESLTEEYNTLQMENELMREGKSELLTHCTDLERELEESQKTSSDYSKKVEALEENLSSMLEDFVSKEKNLGSEIDKLLLTENLSNQLLAEKSIEVENLQMEIVKLKNQFSAVNDEGERTSSEFEEELSSLRACKTDLEFTLNKVQNKVKMAENELDTLRTESESKVNALTIELSTSRKKHELLTADHEKVKKSFGTYRSNEENLKIRLNDIELKLTVSEYERQKVNEETANLKVKLQNLTHLEEEIFALKAELDEIRSEKVKLVASLQSASADCEDLKIENNLYLQKISCFQTAMSEFEESKRDRVALEEKVQTLKSDLSTREALSTELSQIKRDNMQLLTKLQMLEEDRNEWMKNSQAFEKKRSLTNDNFDRHDGIDSNVVDNTEKVQLLENELAQALEANSKYQNQLESLLSDGKNNGTTETIGKEKFERTRSSLEAELRDIRERYFQMSLNYAEVEAEREDLVMKLKTAKSGSKWFS